MTETSPAPAGAGHTSAAAPDNPRQHERRWLVLGVVAIAQLMVVLDATIVNIALPSAQRALGFADTDRQWVVTAYALAFGSLLLLGGKLGDLFGRKTTFLVGLVGFAVASALGGAAQSFGVLIAARALQGVFGALLAPAALATLATTFTDPKERSKAFGIFGAVAGGGSAVGLVLGGLLTEYLSWRWCLYVNLVFAAAAAAGAVVLLHNVRGQHRPRLDLPGTVLASGGLFCVVFGFSHASTHGWSDRVTLGVLVLGVVLLAAFVLVQQRVAAPLLPLRVVLDRVRGTCYLAVGLSAVAIFGVFLFLTFYLQQVKGFTPVVSGLAFLPLTACIVLASTSSNIVLLPRTGPRPLVAGGMGLGAVGMFLLARLDPASGYASGVLPSLMVLGLGFGLIFAPAISSATYGVAPRDSGVASAMVNTMQQVGGSVGTALLSTVAASSTVRFIRSHPGADGVVRGAVHGYTTAFLVSASIFVVGALLTAALLPSGVLRAVHPEAAPPAPVEADAVVAGRQTTPAPVRAAAAPRPVGPAASLEVSGRVTAPDGSALAAASLTLTDLTGRQLARSQSDMAGTYRLRAPSAGSFLLICAAEQYQPTAALLDVADGALRHDVVLTAATRLRGRVSGDHGDPVGEAFVTLTDVRGQVVGSAMTDLDGAYLLDDLIAGDYTLTATAAQHQPVTQALVLVESRTIDVDLTLRASGEVSGFVRVAGSGQPLPGAVVTVVDSGGLVVGHGRTDPDGRYHFGDLPAGSYTLTSSGYAPVAAAVQVSGGRVAAADLALGPPDGVSDGSRPAARRA